MRPATRAVFLVSEVLGEVGRPVAEAVLGEFQSGPREHFGLTSAGFPLDEGTRVSSGRLACRA